MAGEPEAKPKPSGPGVFAMPRFHATYLRLQVQIHQAFGRKDHATAEKLLAQAANLAPQDANNHYNLACAQALQGRKQEALDNLAKSVELGFHDVAHMKADDDLTSLRPEAQFAKIVARAEELAQKPKETKQLQIKPTPVSNGVAMVSEENTVWDGRNGVFRTFFEFTDKPASAEIIKEHGEVGDLLRKWYKEGTAAGSHGDLYDNHDNDHSNMRYQQFPQLTRVEFCKEAKQRGLHSGLQTRIFYNAITLGNSSTAMTAGPFWRSQTRLAYTDPRNTLLLYAQYVSNHLFLYPEHRDHDAGRNGKGGHGDVYPANTPYVITSQGSSGSDRVFLDAIACALAAFRPEVKQFLAKNGALMPTVQLIFRTCYKAVQTPEQYLTGKAHPSVFQGGKLDVKKMATMAHDMQKDTVPPVIQLKVVEEDQPVVGRDYFDMAAREKLFNTPAAIARIVRSTKYVRRMVVSAEDSRDLNGRPLTWHWAVLRGDAEAIKINQQNETGSVVELLVPYHTRRPIHPGAKMESCRVDIGAFVHNGKHYSAPGFVTFFYLDNEKRIYNEKKLIQVVDYADKEASKNYVDPAIDLPKTWRDEYHYGDDGQLTGWTRTIGKEKQEFTADGYLIAKKDEQGKPVQVRAVKYVPKPGEGARKGRAVLTQQIEEPLLPYPPPEAKKE